MGLPFLWHYRIKCLYLRLRNNENMMKSIIRKAFLLLIPLAVSCDQLMEMLQTEPTVFQVSLTSDSINASQTEVSAKIVCDIKWTAKLQDSSWGSIKETVVAGDNTGIVVIDLGFNQSGESRSNVLVVTAGSKTSSVSIVQEGTETLFKPGKIQLRGVDAATLNFMPGTEWKMTSAPEWMDTPSRLSGLAGVEATMSIKAKEEFVDVGSRNGVINFTFDGKYNVSLPVEQYQTDAIILETTGTEIDCKAQTVSFKVDFNTEYTVSCDEDWIHAVNPSPSTKALNVGEVTISVDENPTSRLRVAHVNIAGGEQGKLVSEFTITQNGRDKILDKTECGLYGVSGTDYIVQPNLMQATRTLNGDGTYSYTILLYKDLMYCTLSGLPVVQEDETRCTLHLTISTLAKTLVDRTAECVLVGQSQDLRWYRVVNGSEYFIIGNCIQ